MLILAVLLTTLVVGILNFRRKKKEHEEWPEKITNSWLRRRREKKDSENKLIFIRAYNIFTGIPMLLGFNYLLFILQPLLGITFSYLLVLPVSFMVSNYLSKGIMGWHKFIEGTALDKQKLNKLSLASSTTLMFGLLIGGHIVNNGFGSDTWILLMAIYLTAFFVIESTLVYFFTRI